MPTKLNDLLTNVTTELIEPRDSDSHYLTSLRLLLRDNTTGALTELTIEADMLTLPDAPVLVWSAMEVDEQGEDRAAWRAKGDSVLGDDLDSELSRAPRQISPERLNELLHEQLDEQQKERETEPPATWTITPDGQEVELRSGREGGLF